MTQAPGRLLPWDSDFFGFTVAMVDGSRLDTVRCDQVLGWCREQGVDCLYFLAAADDPETVRAAEAGKFELMDIRVELEVRPGVSGRSTPALPAGFQLRAAVPEDLPRLTAIAADAHSNSRFFADPRIPTERARALYTTWIERSVRGEFADHALVVETEGHACGYITGRREPDGTGSIGLLGVGPQARGRGVAAHLIHALLDMYAEREVPSVTVVTQGTNIHAQRVYQRCNFLTRSVKLWYHRWFEWSEHRSPSIDRHFPEPTRRI